MNLLDLDFSDHIKKLRAKKIIISELSPYEQWALKNFRNEDKFRNPNLSMTLQWNITNIEKTFRQLNQPGFTAYLTWKISKAINEIPCLNYRSLINEWYLFPSVPVFIPVATGGESRFSHIFLQDPGGLEWNDFQNEYNKQLEEIKKGEKTQITITPEEFHYCNIIGNLPHTRFTGFHPHQMRHLTGRLFIYLGQRYNSEDQLLCPLFIGFDHANADPHIINQLMEKLSE
ncbi:CatA-like O-acetyltransferase [Bacteriovoracaceae bacterium]|nr:CatA-like O-acetyltransferase [Bacteriovoracaceae bacterium]